MKKAFFATDMIRFVKICVFRKKIDLSFYFAKKMIEFEKKTLIL